MHKQSHQNTHPTFTYRKGRIFYFRRKIPSDLRCHYLLLNKCEKAVSMRF